MSKIEMSTPIATRRLRVSRSDGSLSEVSVALGAPIPDPRDPARTWACPYEIVAFGKTETRAIFGIDPMQALILALHILRAELRALARDTDSRFLDEEDLGLNHACRTNLDLAR